MEKTGYFCKICKSIPLIQIVPKEKDIKIFCMCKCHKQLINYDIFMKNYYKTNFNYSEISNDPIYKEYIDPSPIYISNNEINLEKIDKDFNYIIEKVVEYNLEIKTKIIEILKNKINEIEKAYETNKLNNIKIQNLIKSLISNYQSNPQNSSNIKNLLYNKNFNMGYRNKTYSTLDFNNRFTTLDSLVNNVSKYLKSNYILSSYNEQLYTIKTFFNHQRDATCVTEIEPDIIASSSKDSFIILYNLERKKSIYKFKAHNDGVNWLLKINENNLISCGNDNKIKIWPKIDRNNLDLVNSEHNGTTNTEELIINPIISCDFEEPILKIILIDNNYICGCSSKKVFILKYDIKKNENDEDKKNDLNEILSVNFTIIEEISLDKIIDLYKVKNPNNEDIIVVNTFLKLFFLSLPNLNIIKEISNSNNDKQINNLIQITQNEILIASKSYLTIININNFHIKFKILNCNNSTFISKLRDNTILIGTKEGIKRIDFKHFEEISLINKIYSNENYGPYGIYPAIAEKFNYAYEFSDSRLAICSSYGNIRLCKFKIA